MIRVPRRIVGYVTGRLLDTSAKAVGFLFGFFILAAGIGVAVYQLDFAPANQVHDRRLVLQRQSRPECAMDRGVVWLPNDPKSVDPRRSEISTLSSETLRKLVRTTDFADIRYGHGPVHVILVLDPACLPCRALWRNLIGVKNWRNRFTIRLVPVDFVGSGMGEAARILAMRPKPEALDLAASIKPGPDVARVVHNTKSWIALADKAGIRPGLPGLIVNRSTMNIGSLDPGLLDALATPWSGTTDHRGTNPRRTGTQTEAATIAPVETRRRPVGTAAIDGGRAVDGRQAANGS